MASEKSIRGLKTGQVAKLSGVGVETLRFYERRGLLESPPRSPSGYRQYPEDVVARIRFVKRGQELGFSLREIGELLALRVGETSSSADVRQRAEAKIAEIEAKVQDLERMKNALVELTSSCCGIGPVGDCPILEAMEKES